MTSTLGAPELRRSLNTALEGLESHRRQIDDANVYPVPDGDTGTNMVLTMEAVVGALEGVPDRPADVARAVTRAALVGARGNSGVILAQFLRGMSEAIEPAGAGPEQAAAGLKRAAELCYQAMTRPREGTMLTVARAAADAAHGIGDLRALFEAAVAGALEALMHTPDLLPELRENNVVDAGGLGLCIVIEGFAATLSGRQPEPVTVALPGARAVRPRESGSLEFAYEVQYLLDAPDDAAPVIRDRLETIGDSVAVVGGDGLWNVHVHTNDVGHAIEIGVGHGRPHSIGVVAFEDQMAQTRGFPVTLSVTPAAVLVLADGEGFAEVFTELGAAVLRARAIAHEIASAVDAFAAPDVVVIVCASRSLVAAHEAVRLTRRNVEILDAGDEARAFAALLAFTESEDFIGNLTQMRTAIASARAGHANDVAALVEAIRALGSGEVITVFSGAGVHGDERESTRETLNAAFPGSAADVLPGGQTSSRFAFVIE